MVGWVPVSQHEMMMRGLCNNSDSDFNNNNNKFYVVSTLPAALVPRVIPP